MGIGGQIAVKGKALTIEAAGHKSKHHAARPHEGHNYDAATLGKGNDIGTRISNSRTACFGDDAHGVTLHQRLQKTFNS